MKILLLDGFPTGEDSKFQQVLTETLSDTQYEHVKLSETEIAWCKGCFNCWLITPGQCVIQDMGNDIAKKFIQNDLVIFLSPVTFGSYSSHLKKALDRFIPNVSGLFTQHQGETHHVKRYAKYPALAVFGVQQDEGEGAAVFKDLAERNSLNFYPHAFVSQVFSETENDLMAKLTSALEIVGVSI